MNVDSIDIEKVDDIPDIPREELDMYSMLYEEMSAPAHQTRGSSRRSRLARVDSTSTSAVVPSPSSLSSADERSESDAASASASGSGSDADDDEDADDEEG